MGKGSSPRPFTNRSEFEDNFDKIFRKKKSISRIEQIGQNGNDGIHYEIYKEWDEIIPVGKEVLPEYELNKSTGEVEKIFKDGFEKPNGEQFGNKSDTVKS